MSVAAAAGVVVDIVVIVVARAVTAVAVRSVGLGGFTALGSRTGAVLITEDIVGSDSIPRRRRSGVMALTGRLRDR